MTTNQQRLGYLFASLAPLSVGSGVVASTYLIHVDVYFSQSLRYGVGAVALLPFAFTKLNRIRRLNLRELLNLLILAGVGLIGFSIAMVEAVRSSSPAQVGVIIGCTPILITLIASLTARALPGVALIAGALLVAGGSALVNGVGHRAGHGTLWAILALICDALFSLLSAPLVPKLGANALAFSTTLIAFVGLMILAVGFSPPLTYRLDLSEVLAICYLGIVVSMGAFVFWYQGLSRIPVGQAGLFVGLIPIASLGGQLLVTSEKIGLSTILGIAMVLFGIVLGISRRDRSSDLNRISPTLAEPELP